MAAAAVAATPASFYLPIVLGPKRSELFGAASTGTSPQTHRATSLPTAKYKDTFAAYPQSGAILSRQHP